MIILERIIGNHRLRAMCSEIYKNMACNVLDCFERLPDSRTMLHPGIEIRFGWSLLHLVEDDSALLVSEPDFSVWPEHRWQPTINTTLSVLVAQTRLLHSINIEGEDAYFDQFLISAPGALEQSDIFLRRISGISSTDSGWLLGTLADPEALSREEGLEAIPIARLVESRPELLQALSLPSGFIATFSGESLEKVFDAAGCLRFSIPVKPDKMKTEIEKTR